MFNSYVSLPEGIYQLLGKLSCTKVSFKTKKTSIKALRANLSNHENNTCLRYRMGPPFVGCCVQLNMEVAWILWFMVDIAIHNYGISFSAVIVRSWAGLGWCHGAPISRLRADLNRGLDRTSKVCRGSASKSMSLSEATSLMLLGVDKGEGL
jgi:hypothetical protein